MNDYLDVWQRDFSKLEVVAESVTVSDPAAPGGETHGRDEFEAHLRELRAGFPDFTITIEEILSIDGVVMVEWTATATHEGEFNDIPPTDREIRFAGMSKTVVADGKVREDQRYHDFHEFPSPLGLVAD